MNMMAGEIENCFCRSIPFSSFNRCTIKEGRERNGHRSLMSDRCPALWRLFLSFPTVNRVQLTVRNRKGIKKQPKEKSQPTIDFSFGICFLGAYVKVRIGTRSSLFRSCPSYSFTKLLGRTTDTQPQSHMFSFSGG